VESDLLLLEFSGSLWSLPSDKLQKPWALWINYVENKKEERDVAIQRRLESGSPEPGGFLSLKSAEHGNSSMAAKQDLLNNSSLPYTLSRLYSYL